MEMNIMRDEALVVLVTAGNRDEAARIAKALVEDRLAACVNIVPSIRSIYTWQGEVCDDEELLLIIKTRKGVMDGLKVRVRELHSYEVPEVIAFSICDGSIDYLAWIEESTRNPRTAPQ
jgi:periplasmic divalent cation tolerance protein